MQVVINIPDEDFNDIKYRYKNGNPIGSHYLERIVNLGNPLPKKHGRLIDISWFEDNYFNTAIVWDDGDHIHKRYTNMFPTIIEADKESEVSKCR